jgi:hypothetical protein
MRYVVAYGHLSDGRFQSVRKTEAGSWKSLPHSRRVADNLVERIDELLPGRTRRYVRVYDVHEGGCAYAPLTERL